MCCPESVKAARRSSVDRASFDYPSVSPVPNRVEVECPVLRPNRRSVLVAEGEHVRANTQPASFIPTWIDVADDDVVAALQS